MATTLLANPRIQDLLEITLDGTGIQDIYVFELLGELESLKRFADDGSASILKPPVHFLVSAASFLLSKAAYQRYIEPHVLDIRTEHYEALQAGEHHKARWIVIRGYCQALWPLAVAAWGTIVALLKLST